MKIAVIEDDEITRIELSKLLDAHRSEGRSTASRFRRLSLRG